MTFNFAPWAIDGARTTAALGRLASYTTGGGRSGVAKPDSLKVLPLEVPGNGLRITSGGATVLNHYLADPDETYIVSNPGTHVVTSADMPAPVPQTAHYLVCVVVGDPEFDQTDHPYMPSTPIPAEDAPDYEYVRIVVVPCAANTTQFEQLNLAYPAYALARLEVPPNTSTITGAMITDLRKLAQPRSERKILSAQPAAGAAVTSADFITFGSFQPVVEMPPWATRVTVIATIVSAAHISPEVIGQVKLLVGGFHGAAVYYHMTSGERSTLQVVFVGDMPQFAGQNIQLNLFANRTSGTGQISIFDGTNLTYDVQFDENPI